jgi:hypothetical protein
MTLNILRGKDTKKSVKKDYLKAVHARQRKDKEFMEVTYHLKGTYIYRQITEVEKLKRSESKKCDI